MREIIGAVNRLGAAAESAGRPLTMELVREELGLAVAAGMPTPRLSTAVRAGQPFLDFEKVVWDWPDTGARLIEEAR